MTLRPERYRNAVVPHIYVDGAADGIAFYQRAFGAVELFPSGKILHAEISDGRAKLRRKLYGSVSMIGTIPNTPGPRSPWNLPSRTTNARSPAAAAYPARHQRRDSARDHDDRGGTGTPRAPCSPI